MCVCVCVHTCMHVCVSVCFLEHLKCASLVLVTAFKTSSFIGLIGLVTLSSVVLCTTLVAWCKVSASRAADLGSIPAFPMRLFPGRVIPVSEKLVLQWPGYPAPVVTLTDAWC